MPCARLSCPEQYPCCLLIFTFPQISIHGFDGPFKIFTCHLKTIIKFKVCGVHASLCYITVPWVEQQVWTAWQPISTTKQYCCCLGFFLASLAIFNVIFCSACITNVCSKRHTAAFSTLRLSTNHWPKPLPCLCHFVVYLDLQYYK